MIRWIAVSLVMVGCGPTVTKVSRDAKLGDLKADCRSMAGNRACNRVQKMRQGVKALTKLHGEHRAQLAKKLMQFKIALATPELFPTANVELETNADPSTWQKLDGEYEVKATLRLQYESGQNRHKFSGGLMQTFKQLKELASAQAKDWRKVQSSYGGPLYLGEQIARQRIFKRIQFVVRSAKYVESTRLPADLMETTFAGLDEKQRLDLSVMFDDGGLKRQWIKNFFFTVAPAYEVSGSKAGWVINETKAKRQKLTENPDNPKEKFTFKVPANRFCKALRSEVRFYERLKSPVVSFKVQDLNFLGGQ